MDLYKRTYIAVGFRFDHTEIIMPGSYRMIFSFPNLTDPKKPAGGAYFEFSVPKNGESWCDESPITMGVLGHYDAYSLEEHNAFDKIITDADRKAQALITQRVGAPKRAS
jgi:hypothetical protein